MISRVLGTSSMICPNHERRQPLKAPELKKRRRPALLEPACDIVGTGFNIGLCISSGSKPAKPRSPP
jgi:hypothetical protein